MTETLEPVFRAAFGRSMHDEVLNNLPQTCGVGIEALQAIYAAQWFMTRLPDVYTRTDTNHKDMLSEQVEHQIQVYYYG